MSSVRSFAIIHEPETSKAAAIAIGRLLPMSAFGVRRLGAAFASGLHDLCLYDEASGRTTKCLPYDEASAYPTNV